MMTEVIQVCLHQNTEAVLRGRIKKKNLSETSTTGNKISQDQDKMSKEEKVGSSI